MGLLALTLAMVVGQMPPPGFKPPKGPGPSASETAKLHFLTGDIAKAQEWAQRGMKKEPKVCKRLNALIAEYAYLANHVDSFDLEQAKNFISLDRQISPLERGRLTKGAYERFVSHPLELARSRKAGDRVGAIALVRQALAVDPASEEALALQNELEPGLRRDAGAH